MLLVDDQTLFSQSLKRVLELSADDLEIVAVASNGHKAIEFVEQHRPDVVLMDVKMPEMDGVEATRIISDRYPEVNILMLTTFDNDTYVYDAISYGAKGYLLKDISPGASRIPPRLCPMNRSPFRSGITSLREPMRSAGRSSDGTRNTR